MGIKSTHSVNLTIYNIFHIILILFHYFFYKFDITQQQKKTTTFIEYKTRNEKQYSNYKLLFCSRYGLHVFHSRLAIDNSKLKNRNIGKSCCSVHDYIS